VKRFLLFLAIALTLGALAVRTHAADAPPALHTVATEQGESVLVPTPPAATPEQAQKVGQAAARNLEAVAAGEVPIEKATRDLRDSIDPGSNRTFWVLALVFGLVIRPLIDFFVHRAQAIPDDLAGRLTLGACLILFYGVWWAIHKSRPDLPQDWESWLFAGFSANGAGSLFAMRKPDNQPPAAVAPPAPAVA